MDKSLKRDSRLRRAFMRLLFLAVLLVGIIAQTCTVHAAKHPVDGWFKSKSGYSYHYTNNVRASGWKMIDGKYYYFKPETGILQKRKIIKSGNSYYYVGTDGARSTDPNIVKAVDLVVKHSDFNASKEVKLKQVYDYVKKNFKYRYGSGDMYKKNVPGYAQYFFDKSGGECIRFSSGFGYVCLVLGIEFRLPTGYEGRTSNHHTWVEIKDADGTWYIYDISRELNPYHKNHSWFRIKNRTYYTKYNASRYYGASVKNGEVTWKRLYPKASEQTRV